MTEVATRAAAHAAHASVTLDIGPGKGALIIYPAERYRGLEIEISRTSSSGHRVHTGVHERRTASARRLTAIFGSLPTGDYLIWPDANGAGIPVSVAEASVTEVALD